MKLENTEEYNFSIFIVEDDEGMNALIARKLKDFKNTIQSFVLGCDAIEAYSEDTLLLLDYKLTDCSADQIIEKLKAKGYKPDFIIMTGQGDEKIAVNMMKLGARDYIIKDSAFLDKIVPAVHKSLQFLTTEKRLRKSQLKLKENEEKLSSLFNILPVGTALTDSEGSFIDANPSLEEIFNIRISDFLKLSIDTFNFEFVDAEMQALPKKELPWMLAFNKKKRIQDIELGLITQKNNKTIWLNVSAAPIPNDKLGIAITFNDITQNKITEKNLIKSKQRYKLLIDTATEVIYTISIEGKITSINNVLKLLQIGSVMR